MYSTFNICLAFILLWLTLALLWRTLPILAERPLFWLWLLLVQFPFAFSYSIGERFPYGWTVWMVTAGHVLLAVDMARQCISGPMQRWHAIQGLLILGVVGVAAFHFTHAGAAILNTGTYYPITGACITGGAILVLTLLLWGWRAEDKAIWGAMTTLIWFASSIAVNKLYRDATSLTLDYWNWLSSIDLAVHCGCTAAWLMIYWRKE